MSTKQLLITAKAALKDENYEYAIEVCKDVLANKPDSIVALLLKGKCHEELKEYDQAVKSYQSAAELAPTDLNVHKAFMSVYEKLADWKGYLASFVELVKIYETQDDLRQAGDLLNKVTKLTVAKNDTSLKASFYELELPGSRIFDFLEGRLPKPDQVLQKLISIVERNQKLAENVKASKGRVIGKAKTSSNAVAATSSSPSASDSPAKLPEYYQQLINYTHDDDLRRSTELKLLKYKYKQLQQVEDKDNLIDEVLDIASGLVVVEAKDSFPYNIFIEWSDAPTLKDLDYPTIEFYINNFTNGFSDVLRAFAKSSICPVRVNLREADDEEDIAVDSELDKAEKEGIKEMAQGSAGLEWTSEEVMEAMVQGLKRDRTIITSHRLLAELYLHEKVYENAVDIALKGIDLCLKSRKSTGVLFKNSLNHLKTVLATAYIYYESPKNHEEALGLFNTVLKDDANSARALIGTALINREQGDIEGAAVLLQRVNERLPNDVDVIIELAWTHVLLRHYKEARTGFKLAIAKIDESEAKSRNVLSAIWWQLGQSYWKELEESDSEDEALSALAFEAFVTSLKLNPAHAPAYTSLGEYYLEINDDSSRAMKCFFKAFELDSGEIIAAERLASAFADKSQWDSVEVIATRVVESEKLRISVGSEVSWPYRALGIVALSRQDFSQAVKQFQNVIRMAPKDFKAWISLGEAYMGSGRLTAASKTFSRALAIEKDSWVALYQLGLVKKELSEFEESLQYLRQVAGFTDTPASLQEGIRSIIVETLSSASKHYLQEEFYGEAVDYAIECLKLVLNCIKEGHHYGQAFWKAVGECVEVVLMVQSQWDDFPFEILQDIVDHEYDQLLKSDKQKYLLQCLIKFMELSQSTAKPANSTQAVGWYNVAMANLKAYRLCNDDSSLQTSLSTLQRAIKLNNRDKDIWNAYGLASSFLNPRVAQHCFVRSLILNYKQPYVWINLAALYIQNNDLELCNEAIEKAIVIDPDYVLGWLARGLSEYLDGKFEESETHFAHAHSISSGMDKATKLIFAMMVLDRSLKQKRESSILAMEKLLMLEPNSVQSLGVQSLLMEIEGLYTPASKYCQRQCDINEALYESTEDENVLVSFIEAKSALARISVALKKYDAAVEHGQFVLSISGDVADRCARSRLSALLTIGLSQYYLGNLGESIEAFQQALEEGLAAHTVTIVLSQILWAHGEKEIAVSQLFDSIQQDGVSLKIVLSLAAVGLIDGNGEVLDAAIEELASTPLPAVVGESFNSDVAEILSFVRKHKKLPSFEGTPAERLPWQRAAFVDPGDYGVWKNLSPATALAVAVARHNLIDTTEMARAFSSQGYAQRAVFIAPWDVASWQGLARAK